jgi:Endonuclease/Exonuclease/phosphatase family
LGAALSGRVSTENSTLFSRIHCDRSSLPMKFASFNINNINRRLTNLLDWLRKSAPDIVCLQELKAADTEFPAEAIRKAG